MSTPKAPAPPKQDIGGDITKYIEGYKQGLPSLFQAEKDFRPQFTDLNLKDVSSFIGGSSGQEGIFDLLGKYAGQSSGQVSDLRGKDLETMGAQSGLFRGAMDKLSPEQAFATSSADAEARRASAAATGLTPEEQRMSEQDAREAFQSSGRLGGNASIVEEAMNREKNLKLKRGDAAAAGDRSFGMAGNFYTNPGLSTFGSTPLSYQTGGGILQLGLGAIGAGSPQLINPDTGVNLGMQYNTNLFNQRSANAQAKATRNNALFGAVGGVAAALI
jgi:hypothetical protein